MAQSDQLDRIAEALAEALLAPLQEVGRMLALEVDALKERVDTLEQRDRELRTADLVAVKERLDAIEDVIGPGDYAPASPILERLAACERGLRGLDQRTERLA